MGTRSITFQHFDATPEIKLQLFEKVKRGIASYLPNDATFETIIDRKARHQFLTTISIYSWKRHMVAKCIGHNPAQSIDGAKKRVIRQVLETRKKRSGHSHAKRIKNALRIRRKEKRKLQEALV